MYKLIFAIALVAPSLLEARTFDSMRAAQQLGTVLAAEEKCGLSYDQAAIKAWVDVNTDPSDMGFASSLNLMTAGARFDLDSMSQSSLTAHCHAINRNAQHFGFIK